MIWRKPDLIFVGDLMSENYVELCHGAKQL